MEPKPSDTRVAKLTAAATTRVLLALPVIAGVLASIPNALCQESQPGLWEPPPMPVRQAVEALRAITIGDLRKMQDHQLNELGDISRTSVELIALEMKRRALRASRLDSPRSSSGRWRVDDGYTDSGLSYAGTRP